MYEIWKLEQHCKALETYLAELEDELKNWRVLLLITSIAEIIVSVLAFSKSK